MAEIKERIRVLRQVEYGVLSKVENANGIVTLLKELGRRNETSVAVAATHCLRRVFAQLLDPAKNPQLPRPAPIPSTSAGGVVNSLGTSGKEGRSKDKKTKKKRARTEDEDAGGETAAARVSALDGVEESDDEKAARVYQAWLEARYFDFLRVLLGWIAEVDDFHRQGPALRTLMQFVEIEPLLCVSAAKFSRPSRSGGEPASPGAGTIWSGLFAEVMRAIVLGPCSMQPKLLKSLGEDFVNVHDDIRYFLLANVSWVARRALSDNDMLKERQQRAPSSAASATTAKPSSKSSSSSPPRFRLPADSPLRGFQGTAAAFTDARFGSGDGKKTAPPALSSPSKSASKKRKKRKMMGKAGREEQEGGVGVGGDGDSGLALAEEEEEEGGGQKMELAEVSGRLARVLMVVRMVEEQSDLSAFLLPVRLSLPSSSSSTASRRGGNPGAGAGEACGGDGEDLRGDASSSSDSDEESGDEKERGAAHAGSKVRGGKISGHGKGKGKGKVGGGGGTSGGKRRMLAIERLRYHKKAFGDAWLACLRLPLPPALYRRVLLFLPGNVIPYMPSPIRLADFLTAAYDLGGVQSVLALDALFLLMQSHDLDYPGFYDSLYRLVTPKMMYAKYRARFFRMVDLCLTSSHVPAYVVAAFLKRFSRACLQAPPSGALFTLALVRKLIGRHPECLPLISRKAAPPAGSKDPNRLLTSSGALSGTTGVKNRPLPPASGAPGAASSGEAGASSASEALPGATGGGESACADEYDPECQDLKGAGAMNTSLWELAALQNHYHPTVATLARGFLREADKKEEEGEAFAAPSKLAGETYQSLFDQEMRRKIKDVPLAFRRPEGLFDDIPEEGGGVFAAMNFSIS